MKFSGFKIFRVGETIEAVVHYLSVELATGLRDLYTGLSRLTFQDNFQSFQAQVNFTGAQEVRIRHTLGVIPSMRIIVRTTSQDIVDGDTAWDENYVFIKKTSAGAASATVIFLR